MLLAPNRRLVLRKACLLALLLGAASCKSPGPPAELVPFTSTLRARYELENEEIQALQYYISEQIVLERVATEGVRRIKRGRLIVRSGTRIQQVVVEPRTPGIVEPSSLIGDSRWGHAIEVSFVPGAPLNFAAHTSDGGYSLASARPSAGGLLDGLFSGWGRRRSLEVLFDGSEWRVAAGANARLMIERDALGALERRRRVLPGVRLPDSR